MTGFIKNGDNLVEELLNFNKVYNNYKVRILGDFNDKIRSLDVVNFDLNVQNKFKGIDYGRVHGRSKDVRYI